MGFPPELDRCTHGNRLIDGCQLCSIKDKERITKRAKIAEQKLENLLIWAYKRYDDEVKHRPEKNIYRETLHNTWNQIIKKLGGEPR